MSALRTEVRRHSEGFLAFAGVVERLCAWLGGGWLYRRRFLTKQRLSVRRERVEVRGLPRGLEGLRIAQLSDLHAGRFLRAGDLRGVVEAVNAESPDLCVLTGDYISHHWSDATALTADLAELRTRFGTLAVFGNHDYRDRAEGRIAEAWEQAGVSFLRNAARRFDTGEGVLAMTGLEDLEEAKHIDLESARASLEPGDVEVLLCHNPSAAARMAREGCVAILSGHTHGVQVDLPILRRFGPPHPGLRIEYGSTTSIISRGLGAVAIPLRWGSPAEVVLVELVGGGEDER
jgi:uncharacterized protein